MDGPRLYVDEDVHVGVSIGLRRRGFDVVTTADADRLGTTDEEQLRFSIAERRCLFTFNRGDFAQIHARLMKRREHHFGIVVSPQTRVGTAVRMLSALLATRNADELRDRLIWLSAGT